MSNNRGNFSRLTIVAALTVALAGAPAPAAASTVTPCAKGASLPGPPPVLVALGATPKTLSRTGKGVLVAIIDSGIDGAHPQLTTALAPGSHSLISDGNSGDGLSDPFGHGTAVAGIIAARPHSDSGVIGIAPEAQLISIRVFSSINEQAKQQGTAPTAERLALGITAATKLGAQIIVVAMSTAKDIPALRAATATAYASGSLIVASAGNRDTTANKIDSPRYPAAYPEALAVTAVTLHGRPTSAAIHGSHIDVAAPGQNVLTTASGAGDCLYASDKPSASFSTAYAAGTAALLAEAYPHEGPAGWMYRLQATADRPNPDVRDNLIGWGRIWPSAALNLRPDPTTRGPVNPFNNHAGSAISRPRTQISSTKSVAFNPAATIICTVIFGGIILILALVARLRREIAD